MAQDVWWFQGHTPWDRSGWPSVDNGRWFRLPDAPFTPRADMLSHTAVLLPSTWDRFDPPSTSRVKTWEIDLRAFYVLGGQVDHRCHQPLLGVCDTEIWQLNVSRSLVSTAPSGLSFVWSDAPVGYLPSPGRCGAAVIHDGRMISSQQQLLVGIIGGQLSYGHNASTPDDCSAPIETVNDAWYSSASALHLWRRGRQAPFSPRRSMQEDDAFVQVTDFMSVTPIRAPLLDKSTSLVGGVRYTGLRYDPRTRTANVTGARVFADAWSCTLPSPPWDSSPTDCDFSHSFPIADLSSTGPFLPSGSWPVPTAHAASLTDAEMEQPFRVGGATPRAAVRRWLSTPPFGQADSFLPFDWRLTPANLTALQQPQLPVGPGPVDAVPTMTVADSRFGLPTEDEVGEAELNDPQSSFALGSDGVVSQHTPPGRWKVSPMCTTYHVQAGQMVQRAEDSTPWLYLATTSINTTRALFDFRLGRLGHSMASTWNAQVIAGGHSGALYSNDWVTMRPQLCLWPDDPSFTPLLGNVRSLGVLQPRGQQWASVGSDAGLNAGPYYTAQFAPGDLTHVACAAGWHFEPPLEDAVATLTCSVTGLWLDMALGSVRRCVRDRLACRWPFTDAGYPHCVDPLPVVRTMRAVISDLHQRTQPDNAGPTRVVGLSSGSGLLGGVRLLIIEGEYLAPPITVVMVSGFTQQCRHVQLVNVTRHCADDSDDAVCRHFGTAITCLLPDQLLPEEQRVVLSVGPRNHVISMVWTRTNADPLRPLEGQAELLIESLSPSIVSLTSVNCSSAGDALGVQLVDCPLQPFPIQVCVSMSGAYLNVSKQAFYWSTYTDLQHLPCVQLDLNWWGVRTKPRDTDPLCDPRLPTVGRCSEVQMCYECEAQMPAATHALGYGSAEHNNAAQLIDPSTAPTLTVRECGAGYVTNYTATDLTRRCSACLAGTSTHNLNGSQACIPCPRGHFSAQPASPDCDVCAPNTYAPDTGLKACLRCGPSRWQRNPGADRCNSCEDGQYKVLTNASLVAPTAADVPCALCPAGAACSGEGTIFSQANYYVLIDRQAATISTIGCDGLACVQGAEQPACQQRAAAFLNATSDPTQPAVPALEGVQVIAASGLGVINCCGPNRKPSIDVEGNVNVLCSECEEGYTEVGYRCIVCREVQWAPLFGLLLLVAVFVYLLHRLSRDTSGMATLSILVYFVQMSVLFLAVDLLPWSLSVLTLNLDVTELNSPCILPLNAYGKIIVRALSPAVAMAMLALLLLLQLAIRHLINAVASHTSPGGSPSPLSPRLGYVVLVYRSMLPCDVTATEADDPSRGDSPVRTKTHTVASNGQLSPLRSPLLVDSAFQFLELPPAPPAVAGNNGHVDEAKAEDTAPASAAQAAAAVTGDTVGSVCRYYRRSALLLLLYSYNTLTTVAFACLHSRQVGEFGQRLYRYPSIDLDSAEYGLLAASMICLVVLAALGGPIALLLVLLHQYRLGRVGPHAVASAQQWPAESDSSLRLFLTNLYTARYFFYTSVVLLRRLLLIILLTFTAHPYTWLSVANGAFLALHLQAAPFRHRRDNQYEALILAALALQTTVLTAYPSAGERPRGVTALLVLLFVVPVAVGGVLFAVALYQRWRRARDVAEVEGSPSHNEDVRLS